MFGFREHVMFLSEVPQTIRVRTDIRYTGGGGGGGHGGGGES
jgi:hypothetical protein